MNSRVRKSRLLKLADRLEAEDCTDAKLTLS